MPRIYTYNLDGTRMHCPRCNSVKVEHFADTAAAGERGGSKTSQALVVRQSLTRASSVSLVTRHTYRPKTLTPKAQMVAHVDQREASKFKSWRENALWYLGIPGFFGIVMLFKGSPVMLFATLALAAAVHFGMMLLIAPAEKRDRIHLPSSERWLWGIRCWHCDLSFYDPAATFKQPENQKILEEQARQFPLWDGPARNSHSGQGSYNREANPLSRPESTPHIPLIESLVSPHSPANPGTPEDEPAPATRPTLNFVFGALDHYPKKTLSEQNLNLYPWRSGLMYRLHPRHLAQEGVGQKSTFRVIPPGEVWQWQQYQWVHVGRTDDPEVMLRPSGQQGVRAAYTVVFDANHKFKEKLLVEINPVGRIITSA